MGELEISTKIMGGFKNENVFDNGRGFENKAQQGNDTSLFWLDTASSLLALKPQ